MRVIAGELKGQRLVAPRGWKVRPTSDRAREAIFSVLGDRVSGARVLDLYCGTGALAIEALSRGAAGAILVDRDTRAALGNVERLADALDEWGAETLLLLFARAHYRSPMDYNDDTLGQARAAGEGLRESLRRLRTAAAITLVVVLAVAWVATTRLGHGRGRAEAAVAVRPAPTTSTVHSTATSAGHSPSDWPCVAGSWSSPRWRLPSSCASSAPATSRTGPPHCAFSS